MLEDYLPHRSDRSQCIILTLRLGLGLWLVLLLLLLGALVGFTISLPLLSLPVTFRLLSGNLLCRLASALLFITVIATLAFAQYNALLFGKTSLFLALRLLLCALTSLARGLLSISLVLLDLQASAYVFGGIGEHNALLAPFAGAESGIIDQGLALLEAFLGQIVEVVQDFFLSEFEVGSCRGRGSLCGIFGFRLLLV